MIFKYRVHEFAKDFDLQSKEISKLLEKYFKVKKKHMSTLTKEELDFLLDSYTQKTQVCDLTEYFSRQKKPGERTKSKKSKEAKNISFKETKSNKDLKKIPEKKQKPPIVKEMASKRNIFIRKNELKARLQKFDFATKNQTKLKPSVVPQKRPSFVRVVNTRSGVNVDHERFNEKYEHIASECVRFDNNSTTKQKINHRFNNRRYFSRYKRETEDERLKRILKERKAKAITILIPDEITVVEFALRLKATAAEVIKKLIEIGVMVTINDTIDFDVASLVANEFHAKVEKEVFTSLEEKTIDTREDEEESLEKRAPVVVVMGHVDHGKTSLLDVIRKTSVTESEFGGITQHIGAYRVKTTNGYVTFIDTPGHEAFTTMRARGAQITDIAVIVIAADDGVMPQTIEAISHAKDAGVSIIVAINKIDKEGSDPDKIKQQLSKYEVVPEDWGGDVPCVNISAKTEKNITALLENIALMAEIKDLKANPNRSAKGAIIEARLDRGHGHVATVLVQNGTLKISDLAIAGASVGRIREMFDDKGQKIKEAGPSVPVKITGLDFLPNSGDTLNVVSDERLARELVEQRKSKQKEERFQVKDKLTADNFLDQIEIEKLEELKIIVKADTQGSAQALKKSLENLTNDKVKVSVIHAGAGIISESDVILAYASNAMVIGFNAEIDTTAGKTAKLNGTNIKFYSVIYDCIKEIEEIARGLVKREVKENILGHAECRHIYKIAGIGTIAGSYVTDGEIIRGAKVRVFRESVVVAQGIISSLKRFKDDAKEVSKGYECGISLSNFNDIKKGDTFEPYEEIEE